MMIKIDCEGSEYGILFGIRIETLDRARQVIVECGKFGGGPKYSQAELETYLNSIGFLTKSHNRILYVSKPDVG